MADTLPDRLRQARDLAGISARKLSRLADLAPVHVSLIESNERPRIEAETAEKLARVLGISLDWLISGTGKLPPARTVLAAVTAAETSASDADDSGPYPTLKKTKSADTLKVVADPRARRSSSG